ncbi:AAA family ATPase [Corynebacterium kalidii]
MKKIRVGSGFMKRPLLQALEASRPGDILFLDEGEYNLEWIRISGITLSGTGDPSRVRLTTQINVQGINRIENMTLAAPPFKNAINVSDTGARVDVRNCRIQGEPTGKYPAVYNASGQVILNGVGVASEAGDAKNMVIEEGGQLTALGTDLGAVVCSRARIAMENSRTRIIFARDRTTVESTGQLTFNSGDNQRALVVEGESTCRIPQMMLASGAGEIYCDDGYIELGEASLQNGKQLRALTKGNGTVRTGSGNVEIVDLDRPAEPEPAPGPKEVVWRQEDNRRFVEAVLPAVGPEDTIMLEEGEYYLDDLDGVLLSGVDIRGSGCAEHTVINGSIAVMEECTVSLSNFTLRPRVDNNGLYVGEGTAATITNVTVDPCEGTQVPAVYLAGTLWMSRSRVNTDPGTETLSCCVAGGVLDAEESFVGRLTAEEHGSVSLRSTSSETLHAFSSSTIRSSGGHRFVGTDYPWRRVMAVSGARVEIDEAVTDDGHSEVMSDAALTKIDRYTCPEEGKVIVFTTDGGTADIGGDAVVLAEEAMTTAVQPAHPEPATPGDNTPPGAASSDDEESGDQPDAAGTGAAGDQDGGDPLAALQAMTGLDKVKEQVQDFIREVRVNQARRNAGLKTQQTTLHSMFLGNPGTGKTTVARLLGKALYNAGAVEKDLFVEVSREDLVSPILGQTASQTKCVLDRARGAFCSSTRPTHCTRRTTTTRVRRLWAPCWPTSRTTGTRSWWSSPATPTACRSSSA